MPRIETVLRLRQVGGLLPRFDLRYEDRALRYAMRGVGIEPVIHVANASTGKGRVLLYDALTPLVLAAAHHSKPKGPLRDLGQPLDRYRQLAKTKAKAADSKIGLERMTGYIFIMSAEYGIDIRRLASLLDGSPRLDEVIPEDEQLLPRLLRTYQGARTAWEAELDLFAGRPEFTDPAEDPLVKQTLKALAEPDYSSSTPEVSTTQQDNVVGERFTISEFFDGSMTLK